MKIQEFITQNPEYIQHCAEQFRNNRDKEITNEEIQSFTNSLTMSFKGRNITPNQVHDHMCFGARMDSCIFIDLKPKGYVENETRHTQNKKCAIL